MRPCTRHRQRMPAAGGRRLCPRVCLDSPVPDTLDVDPHVATNRQDPNWQASRLAEVWFERGHSCLPCCGRRRLMHPRQSCGGLHSRRHRHQCKIRMVVRCSFETHGLGIHGCWPNLPRANRTRNAGPQYEHKATHECEASQLSERRLPMSSCVSKRMNMLRLKRIVVRAGRRRFKNKCSEVLR
jgi:hypothetical protein